MALDGAFLYAVRQELSGLIGSRIEKIHQPAREEILISLRNMEGSHKILISASADRSARCISPRDRSTPPQTRSYPQCRTYPDGAAYGCPRYAPPLPCALRDPVRYQ